MKSQTYGFRDEEPSRLKLPAIRETKDEYVVFFFDYELAGSMLPPDEPQSNHSVPVA